VCAENRHSVDGGCRTTTNSRELLRRARDGDVSAANHLFARYLPVLYRWAHRRVPAWARGISDTADVVHDAVLHTLRHIPSFAPQRDGALLGYLRCALVNRIRDQFRTAVRRPMSALTDEDPQDASASPLDDAMGRQDRERYLRALKDLRPADRHAIVARLELGYTYEQLALVLRKPSAVAARLAVRRALMRLARRMEHG